MTSNELATAIAKLAEVDIVKLPKITRVRWLPPKTIVESLVLLQLADTDVKRNEALASTRATTFDVGQPCPIEPKHHIFAIFDGGDEWRVYTVAGELEGGPPRCFAISKVERVWSVVGMDINSFASEVAAEFVQLSLASAHVDDEGKLVMPTPPGDDDEETDEPDPDDNDEPAAPEEPVNGGPVAGSTAPVVVG